MPTKLDEALSDLKEQIVEMGNVAQEMIQTAMRGLVERDTKLIDRVNELENQIDRFQIEVDDAAVRLMAMFGPVALDLRFVLMVARINTELERVGDQAVNMCEHAQLLLREPELKKLVDLPRMAQISSEMVKESLQAFREGSTSKATEVIKADGEVDALNDQIFRELLTYMLNDANSQGKQGARLGINLTALSLFALAIARLRPYSDELAHCWKHPVKQYSLLLAGMISVLNYARSRDLATW
ncbi:MAG: phosphate signaling complex protein PhoU, partial [Planctomycetes bacterium]|nr:phosphate signaling complex protein PhoU [Planctomycetota bacterium]